MFSLIKYKIVIKFLFIVSIFYSTVNANESAMNDLFDNNSAKFLIIDSKNGNIVKANKSSSLFFKYSIKELENKSIENISYFTLEKIKENFKKAKSKNKNYFILRQKDKDGVTNRMEINFHFITYENKEMFFAIIYGDHHFEEEHTLMHDYSKKLEIQANQAVRDLIDEESKIKIVYRLFSGILFAIIIILIYNIFKRKKIETLLLKSNKELKDYELVLEKMINEKTSENLEQLNMLQKQNKLALMGEMMGTIAHQWRQPLNSLSLNIQNLDIDFEDGDINKEFIDKFIDRNRNTINFMSKTIDDFRNFFRVDKERDFFSVEKAIKETITLLNASLLFNDITIDVQGEDFEIDGYENEFKQVILNIIDNAKDELVSNNIEDKRIDILLEDKNTILIQDNAGGIKEDVIDKIFDPYFTTKKQGEGTGIGLCLSKTIIEKSLQGIISAKNITNGAQFKIYFSDAY